MSERSTGDERQDESDEHFALLDQVGPKLSPRGSPRGGARGRDGTALNSSVASSQDSKKLLRPDDVGGQIQFANRSVDSASLAHRTRRAASTSAVHHTPPPPLTDNGKRGGNSNPVYRPPQLDVVYDRSMANGISSSRGILSDPPQVLETYWIESNDPTASHRVIDDFVPSEARLGSVYNPALAAAKKRNPVKRLFVEHVNLGVVGVVLCVLLLCGGLVCRLVPDISREVHHDVGRFLLSAGIFGLASALSNYVAVKVLLRTMFLSRHENALQTSLHDIMMNIFFPQETVEEELTTHIRKVVSTTSLTHILQQVTSDERCTALVDRYVQRFLRTPQGIILSMHAGVNREKLIPLVVPAVLSIAADVTPILSDMVNVKDVVNTSVLLGLVERVVSHRAESLSITDLKGIVSGVLSPHLALLVLWGSLFGIVLGLVAEAFTLSHFLSGCVEPSS